MHKKADTVSVQAWKFSRLYNKMICNHKSLLWSQRAHTETKLRDSRVRFNVAYSQDRTHVHVGSALWPTFDFLQ